MNQTLEYYAEHAASFAEGTQKVDFSSSSDRFLAYLAPEGRILDFGCGAGRDTKYFLDRGYRVDAVDGSPELCRLASEFTGIPVRQMLFQELDAVEEYDGIWACASILHLPSAELKDVLGKIVRALKPDGLLYTSFKYGTFEGLRNGRYFTDHTEVTFGQLLAEFPELRTEEQWITADVRPGRSEERWLNVILRKTAQGSVL